MGNLFFYDSVMGSCDYAVAEITLSREFTNVSPMTLQDDTIVQIVKVNYDGWNYDGTSLEIYLGEDIHNAMNSPGNTMLGPSYAVTMQSTISSMFAVGSSILLTLTDKSVFCSLNVVQLESQDGIECDEEAPIPLLPNGEGIEDISFTSLNDTSFVALSPGGPWDSAPRDPDITYCIYSWQTGCTAPPDPIILNATFMLALYDRYHDNQWMQKALITGSAFSHAGTGSVVAISEDCVAIQLGGVDELYFINLVNNEVSSPLLFDSTINKIEVIEEGTLAVIVCVGEENYGKCTEAEGSIVYMLSDTDIGTCGKGVALADTKKGFFVTNGSIDFIKKLHDGTHAMAVNEQTYRSILMYDEEPRKSPYTQPSHWLQLQSSLRSSTSVDMLDEFITPETQEYNLVIHQHSAANAGIFFPENHPIFFGSKYYSPVRGFCC